MYLEAVSFKYNLRARFYNPAIARFTQEDEYRGDGLNLYAYCKNNAVMYEDPSGFKEVEVIVPSHGKTEVVPGNTSGFNTWYNSLTPNDVYSIFKSGKGSVIKNRLRGDGGVHEWFMVSLAPVTKQWGITSETIKGATTKISQIEFIDIETKRFGVKTGHHGNKNGSVEASVSSTAHIEIENMIKQSSSPEEFSSKLRTWADEHLVLTLADGTVIKDSKGLPDFFRDEEKIESSM